MDDPDQFDYLRLDMMYDDGFVAYLNGLEVASPSDFNETVLSVVRPVSVAADNVLTVELRGDLLVASGALRALREPRQHFALVMDR